MGKQIAVQCAGHGRHVTLYDIESAVLDRAKDQLGGIVDWLTAQDHIGPSNELQSWKRLKSNLIALRPLRVPIS